MKVTLTTKTKPFHFEATTELGKTIDIDSSPEIGGQNLGVRPMELVLIGVGGCSGIDLGLILKKQRQVLDDFKVSIDGHRSSSPAKEFKQVDIHFELWGNLDKEKVEKAISLTVEKYCSVIQSLSEKIKINTRYTIHHE